MELVDGKIKHSNHGATREKVISTISIQKKMTDYKILWRKWSLNWLQRINKYKLNWGRRRGKF